LEKIIPVSQVNKKCTNYPLLALSGRHYAADETEFNWNQFLHSSCLLQVSELREELEREHQVVAEADATQLAGLTTQLELANVQRAEFEEAVERLQQELRDTVEDKKIAEKKGERGDQGLMPLWIVLAFWAGDLYFGPKPTLTHPL
jgi:hypothetical protein